MSAYEAHDTFEKILRNNCLFISELEHVTNLDDLGNAHGERKTVHGTYFIAVPVDVQDEQVWVRLACKHGALRQLFCALIIVEGTIVNDSFRA